MPSAPDLNKAILSALSRDFAAGLTPYEDLARELGIPQELLLARIKDLVEEGKIRRVGATLNHRSVGFLANALTVWNVPREKIEAFAGSAVARREISHCYLRKTYPNWPYNIYTVIHGTSPEACQSVAGELAEALQITDYQLLFSLKEFKKSRLQL